MRALFIIDTESFSPKLKEKIAVFRRQVPPSVSVLWTVTGHHEPKPAIEDGFQAGRDRLYLKRDVDSTLESSIDENGVHVLDYLRTLPITEAYVAGATHYGCVLGACLNLREVGIKPFIVQDMTDFDELKPFEHEEAQHDWKNAAMPIVSSSQALSLMQPDTSPKPAF